MFGAVVSFIFCASIRRHVLITLTGITQFIKIDASILEHLPTDQIYIYICTMSNYPLEQVDSFPFWPGSSFPNKKRPQQKQHFGSNGTTILFNDDEDFSHPTAKRLRFEGPPSSPGAVSLTTASSEQDHEIFMEEQYQQNVSSQEWWKKKPKQACFHDTLPLPMEPRRLSAACCFICNQPSVAYSNTVALNLQQTEKLPVKNSLLNYFSTTRSLTSSHLSSSTPPSQQQHLLSSCSFCDRQSCLACSTQCQECQQRFCTLCTTTDYSSTVERSYCLDCAHTAANGGGDAMAIDEYSTP